MQANDGDADNNAPINDNPISMHPIVTSAEEEDDNDDSDNDNIAWRDDDDEENSALGHRPAQEDFYDDTLDAQDEAYVQSQRVQHLLSSPAGPERVAAATATAAAAAAAAPNSDAILSCPCCFTTLCLDCQAHEKYAHQFRAMFVMNVSVPGGTTTRLVYSRHAQALVEQQTVMVAAAATNNNDDEWYQAVYCAECHTQVAALDQDEVYHFYHCLAAQA